MKRILRSLDAGATPAASTKCTLYEPLQCTFDGGELGSTGN